MTRRVAVLMGGISPEHPVSLDSGCGILAQLDRDRYLGFPVLVSRDNVWIWPSGPARFPASMTVEQAEAWLREPPEGWSRAPFERNGVKGEMLLFPQADVFFLALHGVGGEDGTLQAFLESAGQPFTGSGSAGSRTAMDKIRSKEKYREHGISTAPWIVVTAQDSVSAAADRVERELGLPAVVKHPTGGSSIGVVVAKTRADLERAIAEIGRGTREILVEAFLPGREATCGVLEGFATPLPPTEIRPRKDAFFSFEEKYRKDGAQEITPAEFPADVNAEIQRLAAKAHAALGLSVYSRTDFIWTGATLNALETNNLPGFTPKSILPQQAASAGLSYRDLVTHIIEQSLGEGLIMGPLGLVLDLSHAGFAAVLDSDGTQVLAQSSGPAATRHDDVADWTESLLRAAGGGFADLAWIAVGIGPGSFTGIRIAMAFAQGIALPHGVPLHGFTGFEALHLSFPGQPGIAVVPANAGRFYVSHGISDVGTLILGEDLARLADSGLTVLAPEVTPALKERCTGFAGVWTPGEDWDAVAIARHARASGRGGNRPAYLQLSAAEEKFGRADA